MTMLPFHVFFMASYGCKRRLDSRIGELLVISQGVHPRANLVANCEREYVVHDIALCTEVQPIQYKPLIVIANVLMIEDGLCVVCRVPT